MSKPGYQLWRAGFLKRSFWFLCRRRRYWRVERADRVYRALVPICTPGGAEAAAEKYYRDHTGNEEPRSIDDAILVGIHGDRALRKAAPAEGETMRWKLVGDFYENCSCDAICPCTWSNLAHKATRDDYCRFALAFDVDLGEIGGVDVSGRSFVMIADTPPNMADGNWRVGVIVDDGANEEQVGKFGQVLSGELGGPPAALAPFVGEFLGIEQAPISIERDGSNHRVKVGALVDYSGERVTVESGDPVRLTNIVAHPAGPTLGLAPVSRAQVSAFGIEYSGQDLSGFANRFSWNG